MGFWAGLAKAAAPALIGGLFSRGEQKRQQADQPSGLEQGQDAKDYYDTAFPDTTQWERLGVPSPTGGVAAAGIGAQSTLRSAGIQSAAAAASAANVARIQQKTAVSVAEINAEARERQPPSLTDVHGADVALKGEQSAFTVQRTAHEKSKHALTSDQNAKVLQEINNLKAEEKLTFEKQLHEVIKASFTESQDVLAKILGEYKHELIWSTIIGAGGVAGGSIVGAMATIKRMFPGQVKKIWDRLFPKSRKPGVGSSGSGVPGTSASKPPYGNPKTLKDQWQFERPR